MKSFKILNGTKICCGLQEIPKKEKFFVIIRTYDIPNTMEGMWKGLPDNCIGFSVNYRGGSEVVRRAINFARKRNMFVLITSF